MKFKKLSAALGMFATLLLADCPGYAYSNDDAYSMNTESEEVYETGLRESDAGYDSEQKVIYSGNIDIDTMDLTETTEKIKDIVKEYKCIISKTTENASTNSVEFTILVPNKSFDTVMDKLSKQVQGYHVNSKKVFSEDATLVYNETEEDIKYYKDKLKEIKKESKSSEVVPAETPAAGYDKDYYQEKIKEKERELEELQRKVDYGEINLRVAGLLAGYVFPYLAAIWIFAIILCFVKWYKHKIEERLADLPKLSLEKSEERLADLPKLSLEKSEERLDNKE